LISGLKLEWRVGGRESGDDTLERMAVAFERAGSELENFGQYLFPRMQPLFEQEMRDQFSAEGKGASGSWAPLSAQYAEWKEEHYPGRGILVREGNLYAALTDGGSPFARRVVTSDTFDFGTLGLEYASIHQLGGGRVPARPVFDFGDDFERLLTQEGAAAAREAIAAAGADEYVDTEPLS
jgi:phage gpG-like protein